MTDLGTIGVEYTVSLWSQRETEVLHFLILKLATKNRKAETQHSHPIY